jgi:hypothetical protein
METATTCFEEMPRAIVVTPETQAPSQGAAWPNAIVAGSLFGDLSAVAKEVYRAVQRYPVTAWMNADADVLYQPADSEGPAIIEWIAGTYASGASAADIEDDLNQLCAQRRAMGMIEV